MTSLPDVVSIDFRQVEDGSQVQVFRRAAPRFGPTVIEDI